MKTKIFAIASALMAPLSAQVLPNGTIIPERIIFAEGQPNASNDLLTGLTNRSFREFEGEAILLMYHSSW